MIARALAHSGVPLPVEMRADFAGRFTNAPRPPEADVSDAQPLAGRLVSRPTSPAELRATTAARIANKLPHDADSGRGSRRFDAVRVHDDRSAHRAASALGARAFAVGTDIFFAAGEYKPRSSAGRDLIAHELAHVTQARGPQQVFMRQVAGEVNRASREYLRGYNDGRANKPPAPGPLTSQGLAEYDAGHSSGLAVAARAQASLPPVTAVPVFEPLQSQAPIQPGERSSTAIPPPPDAAFVERITRRKQELEATYVGKVPRPLSGALSPSDYRLTPTEVAKLRRRAESLRQVVAAMRQAGLDEDASIMSHIIGGLLTDAKIAEVQWGQLSESAKNYWLMIRDHPEWRIKGNALTDMTGAIVQESQSADVQFVMAIFIDGMTATPPRGAVTPKSAAVEPPANAKPPAISGGDVDKAFGELESGKIPQGEPAVRVQVRPGGEPAQVGDVGAGPKRTDLGIPPERELVAVERMDKSAAGSPDRILDASGTFPSTLYGKYDTLILNNPRGFTPNIAELSKGLTPNGKIILQGNWKANPDFRRIATQAEIPAGMKRTVERNVQPLGRGFSYTDTTRPGAPVVDSRITIEFAH